jgi:hypothetical protein
MVQWMVILITSQLYNLRNYKNIYFYNFISILDIALVKMYEHKLKELNPGVTNITYDVSDLNNYIDSFFDCCGLV